MTTYKDMYTVEEFDETFKPLEDDDSNGPYYSLCPLCGSRTSYNKNESAKTMQDISHPEHCLRTKALNTIREINK